MTAPRAPQEFAYARRRAKLRWRCRRGMKELDVLFERFLERGFDELNDEHLDLLEALLDSPDQDLFDWLGGDVEPDDEGLALFTRWLRMRIALVPLTSAERSGRR